MSKKMFDFSEVKMKSPTYFKLRIDKVNYIMERHEKGKNLSEIAEEIGVSIPEVRNEIIMALGLKSSYPVTTPKRKEFYKAYCGELFKLMAAGGIDTFTKLEDVVKKQKLTEIKGIGIYNAKAILSILEDHLKAEKNVKKTPKKVTTKTSKKRKD